MELFNTLQQLTAAPGPAGFEGSVAALIAELAAPYADNIYIDKLGTVRCIRSGRQPETTRQTLLLDAHIDEPSLIVTHHEDDFLRVGTVGKIDVSQLPGQQVTVLAGETPLTGFIPLLPPHLLQPGEKAFSPDNLVVDVGLSGEALKQAVPLGTPVVYDAPLAPFGDGMATGKALHSRAGVAAALYALKLLSGKQLPFDVAVAGSVRRGVDAVGAVVTARALRPTWALVAEGVPATDNGRGIRLSDGIGIGTGPNFDPTLREIVEHVAAQQSIASRPYVTVSREKNNAKEIQALHTGIPTALLGIPVQGLYSPVEVVRLSAIALAGRLMAGVAEALAADF